MAILPATVVFLGFFIYELKTYQHTVKEKVCWASILHHSVVIVFICLHWNFKFEPLLLLHFGKHDVLFFSRMRRRTAHQQTWCSIWHHLMLLVFVQAELWFSIPYHPSGIPAPRKIQNNMNLILHYLIFFKSILNKFTISQLNVKWT